VVYNVGTGARRKSSVRVEDVGRVFLRWREQQGHWL